MSYGLKVTSFDAGGNPIIQIDTELGLVNYVITKMGTGSGVNLGTFTGKNRLVFIKPILGAGGTYQVNSSSIYQDGRISVKGFFSDSTIQFVEAYPEYYDENMPEQNAHLPTQVDYFVAEDVTGVTPVGDYGLQTLTAGGESAFDSRKIKINTSFDITQVIPRGSLGGFGANVTDIITSDTDKYVCVSPWSNWWDLFSFSGIRIKNNETNIYHIDLDGDPPDPADPYSAPIMYYDNYAPIFLGKLT
jgi:hypothetical protein